MIWFYYTKLMSLLPVLSNVKEIFIKIMNLNVILKSTAAFSNSLFLIIQLQKSPR